MAAHNCFVINVCISGSIVFFQFCDNNLRKALFYDKVIKKLCNQFGVDKFEQPTQRLQPHPTPLGWIHADVKLSLWSSVLDLINAPIAEREQGLKNIVESLQRGGEMPKALK